MRLRLARHIRGRTVVVAVPMVFLLAFFLLPFAIVGQISLADMEDVCCKDLVTFDGGVLRIALKFAGYAFIADDPLYLRTYVSSLKYAAATTLLCLAIGYPFAYFMARAERAVQPALLMLVMLPFWTSFLLRVYAWRALLAEHGWIEQWVVGSGLDT
ncbi:MAG TPA: putrescine ABC transporter permease PotH, partial [Rubrivivax sp.]|nr:putrescine ABC transporter permease PotH [Rubrivivax sp.]